MSLRMRPSCPSVCVSMRCAVLSVVMLPIVSPQMFPEAAACMLKLLLLDVACRRSSLRAHNIHSANAMLNKPGPFQHARWPAQAWLSALVPAA